MPRQDLLDATVAHLREHGLGDASLRQIAEAVGTSHRMLVYHFGSREGLLAAVVDQVETEERAGTATRVTSADPRTAMDQIWKALSAPERAGEERLFFELVGQALQGRPGTEGLLERLIEPWLEAGVAMAAPHGVPRGEARTLTRLDVAVIRGLLLDLLATGDRRGVNAAFRRYADWRATTVTND